MRASRYPGLSTLIYNVCTIATSAGNTHSGETPLKHIDAYVGQSGALQHHAGERTTPASPVKCGHYIGAGVGIFDEDASVRSTCTKHTNRTHHFPLLSAPGEHFIPACSVQLDVGCSRSKHIETASIVCNSLKSKRSKLFGAATMYAVNSI